jgi:adenylyl-sulfate kinase
MIQNTKNNFNELRSFDDSKVLAQNSITFWITGLSASGKSTLAFSIKKALIDLGYFCIVLDGDNMRRGLNNDLGFSNADRRENVRRTAELAKLLNEARLIVIASLISPLVSDRNMAKDIVGKKAFREIYVSTPIEICESRDPKGLYSLARKGILKEFTGVSAPYEPPTDPWVEIDKFGSIEDSLKIILPSIMAEIAI